MSDATVNAIIDMGLLETTVQSQGYPEDVVALSMALAKRRGIEQAQITSCVGTEPRAKRWITCGRAAAVTHFLPESIEWACMRALEVEPGYLPAQKLRAAVLLVSGRAAEARGVYEEELRRSEDSELWAGYAHALAAIGLEDDALQAFRQAVRLQTDPVAVVSALVGASELLQKRGAVGEAEEAYEEARRLDPELPERRSEAP